MYPLAPQHERKTRKDYGTKRGRHSTSTSSSPAFDHLSSSHYIDDDNDKDDEELPHLLLNQNHSRNTPSPQATNPFLDDPLDAPPRPSNPPPLQSHTSLDITFSLSPITPLDHMFETPSPPPPPPPPPLMGHPIFFNVLEYHGAHCLCCFYN
ncbi:hypothetical protein Tco_0649973 [Tanacetum coccineum]